MEKTCTKCKEVKSLDLFYKDSRQKSGYRPDCKACGNTTKIKERKKKWMEDNKEKMKDYLKEYRTENKEHITTLIDSFHEKNPNYWKEYYQKNKLKKSFIVSE